MKALKDGLVVLILFIVAGALVVTFAEGFASGNTSLPPMPTLLPSVEQAVMPEQPVAVPEQLAAPAVPEQPVQAAAQEAVVQSPVDTVQEPVAGVENTFGNINALGDVAVNVYNNAESASAANVDANAASMQEQSVTQQDPPRDPSEYAPGDAPALTQALATQSLNCQNIAVGSFLALSPDDYRPILQIEAGARLFGLDGLAYPIPQACVIGLSAMEWCGVKLHPETQRDATLMLLKPEVFGVPGYIEIATGKCPTG